LHFGVIDIGPHDLALGKRAEGPTVSHDLHAQVLQTRQTACFASTGCALSYQRHGELAEGGWATDPVVYDFAVRQNHLARMA